MHSNTSLRLTKSAWFQFSSGQQVSHCFIELLLSPHKKNVWTTKKLKKSEVYTWQEASSLFDKHDKSSASQARTGISSLLKLG